EGERAVRHAEAGDRVLLSGPGIGMRSGQVRLRSGCWSGTEGGGRGSPGDAQAGGRGAGAAPIAGRATGTQPRPAKRRASRAAWKRAFDLLTVSWNSASGSLSATTPPPAWT